MTQQEVSEVDKLAFNENQLMIDDDDVASEDPPALGLSS